MVADKEGFTVSEAAHFTGLSRSHLYRLRDAGQLKGIKVGGRRLFLRSELQALLHSDRAAA